MFIETNLPASVASKKATYTMHFAFKSFQESAKLRQNNGLLLNKAFSPNTEGLFF